MFLKTSERLKNVPASPIRKLAPYALAAESQGVKVYHLNIGDPDIETPEVMLNVLRKWDKNPISYGQSQGEPALIEAEKNYYRQLGFSFIENSHIQVTSGGSEAISMALFAVTNPGDEIITFEPLYTNYNSYAEINGIHLIPILTVGKNGFHLPNRKTIEEKITPRTKAILYCNPNNPTGTVYSQEEIELLVDIAKKRNLFLLADEVYREFTYDHRKQVSLLNYFSEIPKQAIVLDSLSKRYSLCGARIGFLVSLNSEIMQGVLRIAQGRLSAGLIDQTIASKLEMVGADYFQKVHAEYEHRRNVIYKGLKEIPDVSITKPEGAFYTIVGLPVKDAEQFCRFLLTDFRLNNETVMLAPATGFYATTNKGLNELRIAYVINTEALKKSINILKEALKAYKED